MIRSIRLTLLATGALVIATAIGLTSRGVAQDGSVTGALRIAEAKKDYGPRSGGGSKTVAPRTGGPQTFTAPKTYVGPKGVGPKGVGPQNQFVTPKGVGPKPVVNPYVGPKGVGPRVVGPSGPGFRAIGTGGSGRVYVGGRNYTVWRGPHRVNYGGRWATLAAIGALGFIVYSGARYYPYAYLSAEGPYCEGLTPDGCVLQLQEVPTVEGFVVPQCVAYCPWQ